MTEPTPVSSRHRFTPLLVVAGVVAAVLLSLSMTGTLSAFTAVITNTTNTAGTGTLILKETSGLNTCQSSDLTASCATINKYGGSTTMVPSPDGIANTVSTSVAFANTGTATASSFVLTAQACTQTGTGTALDLCAKLHVKIVSGATTLFNGTATGLNVLTVSGATPIPLALTVPAPGGATVPVTFTVWLDSTAGNAYQGLTASQQLVWTLSS